MPIIELIEGDILATTCEAIVDPVDCTGAQGAGLALAIAQRWPAAAQRYQSLCRSGGARPGGIAIDAIQNPWIIFAATKSYWRDPSQIGWVTWILEELIKAHELRKLSGIAIPALGCGYGGLSWTDVRPLIIAAAERMTCERVEIYEPHEQRQRRGRRG